jgi:hypothetical protein
LGEYNNTRIKSKEVPFMANIKKIEEHNELHKAIWNISDELRGSIGG